MKVSGQQATAVNDELWLYLKEHFNIFISLYQNK